MGCYQSINEEIIDIYVDFYIYVETFYPNYFLKNNNIQKYNNFTKVLIKIIKQTKNKDIKIRKNNQIIVSFLKTHHKEFYNSLLINKKYQKHIIKLFDQVHYNYN